jgi:hypothetical protein
MRGLQLGAASVCASHRRTGSLYAAQRCTARVGMHTRLRIQAWVAIFCRSFQSFLFFL